MKPLSPTWKKTGLCRVCGKPTKLLIHAPCGLKCDAEKTKKVPGMGNLTVQHTENSKHNANKKKWAAGKIPPWLANQ
jgi:hypothetical protein